MRWYITILVAVLFVSCFCLPCFAVCPSMDATGDCIVDFKDFAVFAQQWLVKGEYILHVNSSGTLGVSISSSTGHGGTTNYTKDLTVGTDVSLTAPATVSDVTFVGWTGDVNDSNQTISLSMNGNKTVTARYILTTTNMVWVDINDPGIIGYGGFHGQMSKYETTNAQYCQFLNSAIALGQIVVAYEDEIGSGCYEPGRHVYAVDDINHSRPYYQLDDPQNYNQITYSEATHTFSVRIRDSYNMNDHPVSMVSYHGAKAFCDYCGYRLPTEWEWVAVADYDGTYYLSWPCGLSIDPNKANYNKSNPLGLTNKPYTTAVGHYSTFGYGLCDMTGNVREWLASSYGSSQSRGGSWDDYGEWCKVQEDHGQCSDESSPNLGFRVCR